MENGMGAAVSDFLLPLLRAGNGVPVSALVMTRQLALDFSAGGMEYFNTTGGM